MTGKSVRTKLEKLGCLTYAGRISTVGVGVTAVVASLRIACSGATRRCISLGLREWIVLVAEVGVLAVIKRRVDSSSQRGGACEAIDWVRWAGLVVAWS